MLENEKIIDDIEVELSAVLGKSSLTVHETKEIKPGSVFLWIR